MSGKRKMKLVFQDDHLDLVPLIDCVFLLILFFILCGRMSLDKRTEQISVPPTKTAAKFKDPQGWQRVVVNVYGSTKAGGSPGQPPRNSIAVPPNPPWLTQGVDDYTGYAKLRALMDTVWDRAEKYDDTKTTPPLKLPKVIVELRADSDTEYRVVQEVQQVLTDSIDPSNGMKPKVVAAGQQQKAFINIDFTARLTSDK